MRNLNELERSKKRCRTLIDGKPIYEVLPSMWRDMSSGEISKSTGILASTVVYWARLLGLSHSEETEKRIRSKMLSVLSKGSHSTRNKAMSGERKARWVENRRRLCRLERWRMENGIKRETKLWMSPLTKKQQSIKNFLCSRRKYFSDCRIDPYALFYDEQTVRFSPKYKHDETHYSREFGFRFIPADGCIEERQDSDLSQAEKEV